MITLEQARQLLIPHDCTIVPTYLDKYITVWNRHGLEEKIECSLEAITNYIYSEV
jgi:hypothetical protein